MLAYLAVYNAIVQSYLILVYTAPSLLYMKQYEDPATLWSLRLILLGVGMGMLFGLAMGLVNCRPIRRMERWLSEYALLQLTLGSLFVSSGLISSGWTAQNRLPWGLPVLGTLVTSIGILFVGRAV